MNPSALNESQTVISAAQSETYEPPCVEMVLSADELEREVLYAGAVGTPPVE